MRCRGWVILGAVALAAPAAAAGPAGRQHRAFVVVDEKSGVPVFAGDLPDHPYDVIGTVTAHVRKATVFSSPLSREKIYRELWERADKLGADAVIMASFGDAHVTMISWGSTTAEGVAVKFRRPPAAR